VGGSTGRRLRQLPSPGSSRSGRVRRSPRSRPWIRAPARRWRSCSSPASGQSPAS